MLLHQKGIKTAIDVKNLIEDLKTISSRQRISLKAEQLGMRWRTPYSI